MVSGMLLRLLCYSEIIVIYMAVSAIKMELCTLFLYKCILP